MSWADFLNTKHFGPTVFSPYIDLIADIATEVDRLISVDPPFAKFVRPLVQRDFFFVRGTQLAILGWSRAQHRQHPLRAGITWTDFWALTEKEFVASTPEAAIGAIELRWSAITTNLIEVRKLEDPVVLAFPAIFITKDPSEVELRSKTVAQSAAIIVDSEKAHYLDHIEMQRQKDIFLSHKSADKRFVREIWNTLRVIGFSPWLDEDRMKAGANLERDLKKGFQDSCAAVFFVTPNFVDQDYLATEIDYALAEKREKKDRFSIITLLLPGDSGLFGKVPDLLKTYVYRQIEPIETIRTIVEALPIQLGAVRWKDGLRE